MRHVVNPILTGIVGILLVIFMFALIAAIPMWLLWNWLMPAIFGLPTISLLQALGLNLLAGIIFKSSSKAEKWSMKC
jgi:hypothetical protein